VTEPDRRLEADERRSATSGGVAVVGSVNVDYVLHVERRPSGGETVGGATLEIHPGGKGANQAVAVARSGAPVEMVACVGADADGELRMSQLAGEGVGLQHVRRAGTAATGAAFVSLTPDGENAIVVAPGANALLAPEDVDAALDLLGGASVLVAQLEVPVETVARAITAARPETLVVLNIAPFRQLPRDLLGRVDVLVANEGEALALLGLDAPGPAAEPSPREMAEAIRDLGPRAAVVTLGARGAYVSAPGLSLAIAAPAVDVIDTTGAGDAFVGALAARLALGAGLRDAASFAVAVGSATTEHRGALPRMPASASASAPATGVGGAEALPEPAHGDVRPGLESERRRLRELVADLTAELAGIVESAGDDPPDDEHDIEGSSIAYERSRVKALLAATSARLDAVGGAIERLGDGVRATCRDCGDEIDPERLVAMAGTDRCASCEAVRGGGQRGARGA
jgi:ribokinase